MIAAASDVTKLRHKTTLKPPLSKEAQVGQLVDYLLEEEVRELRQEREEGSRLRSYEEISAAIEERIKSRSISDAVSKSRKHDKADAHRSTLRPDDFDDESDDDSSVEDDEELKRMDFAESILMHGDFDSTSSLYWKALKILRYFLATNRQGTILSLLALRTLNFRTREVVRAFEETEGTALLLNLLSVDDPPVRIGAMRVLLKLASIAYFARLIVHLGGVRALTENLLEPNDQMKWSAARILACLFILKKARKQFTKLKGVSLLVCLLDENTCKLQALHNAFLRELRLISIDHKKSGTRTSHQEKRIEKQMAVKRRPLDSLLKVIGTVLAACSRTSDGRTAMREAGVVSVFGRLIPFAQSETLETVMETLQICCADKYYRISVWAEGLTRSLLKCLDSEKILVKVPCVLTLSQCANEAVVRDDIRSLKGLEIIQKFFDWEITSPEGAIETLRRSAGTKGARLDDENFTSSLLNLGQFHAIQSSKKLERDERSFKINLPTGKGLLGDYDGRGKQNSARFGSNENCIEHETFLVSLTNLIWKLSISPENALQFYAQGAVKQLLRLVTELPRLFGPFRRPSCSASAKLNGFDRAEQIVNNALWALSYMANQDEVRNFIAETPNGITPWLVLLRLTIEELMPATCASIRNLLQSSKIRDSFVTLGGFRILFAYVVNGNTAVKLEALKTIRNCLQCVSDTGKLLKPLIISMETIVSIVRSLNADAQIQKAALETIAQMARDPNTLGIMTDLGVVEAVSRLFQVIYEDEMCISLCNAIAACSYYGKNAKYFGDTHCITILAGHVKSRTVNLRNAAVKAIHGLSFDPENAVQIWTADICQVLTAVAAGNEESSQKAAAGTLTNIRNLEFQATCSL